MISRILTLGDCGPIHEQLVTGGHEVLRGPGRSRAFSLARDLSPDLLFVGVGEDHDDELLRLLAADPSTRLLPIFLVLPVHEDGAVTRLLDAGATDVVCFDMQPSALLARVRSVLRTQQSFRELLAERQGATLRELAGAVAHKMNQPLTSMSVIVETLLMSQARSDLSSERLESKLEMLQRLVDRMAAIVKQVGNVVEYRTTDYVGTVKIIDLEPEEDRP